MRKGGDIIVGEDLSGAILEFGLLHFIFAMIVML